MTTTFEKRSISRRSFLRRGALAAGAVLGFPAIVPSSVFGANAPSNRLTLGVIGLGTQGFHDMRNFLSMPNVQVVAVCDPCKEAHDYGYNNQEAGGREPARQLVESTYAGQMQSGAYRGCNIYIDYREMLARESLDLAQITTPDHWHAKIAVDCLRAGLDVYGEKPLARTIREGRAMCNAVRRYGRVWQTGTMQRSSANFLYACELVRNGRIGKVHRVEVGLPAGNSNFGKGGLTEIQPPPPDFDYDLWLGPAPVAPYAPARVNLHWRWLSDYGAGIATDWGAHHIDIAHWGLGLDNTGPVEVTAQGEFPTGGLWDNPAHFQGTCRYADGLEMFISTRLECGTRFIGDRGWIFTARGYNKAEPASLLKEMIGADEIRLYRSDNHFQNFIDCVKSRRPPISDVEIGQRSFTPAALAEIAMWTGRKIRWNPDTETIINDAGASAMLGRAYREPWALA